MPATYNIFLIEDDMDDIELLKMALNDNGVTYNLQTIIRGDLIINWLETCKELPDIIIMDLNLPKIHGREVLCKIKEKERFKDIPLLVLTTSSSQEDKDFCLKKGADRFFSKPSTTEGFKELIDTIVKISKKRKSSR